MSLQDWIHRLSRTTPIDEELDDMLAVGSLGQLSPQEENERLRRELARTRSERSRLESSLRMLETALETMSMGVTITDREGRIVYVNPADAEMHGWEVSELIGQKARVYSAMPQGEPAVLLAEGEDPEASRWARERLDATKDGRTFPVRLISERVQSDQEEQVATVTICEDLGEREQFREALARRDRILEALALAAEKLLAGSAWEESVEEVLERLGRATGVDLIYILRVKEAPAFNVKSILLGWGTPGGTAEMAFTEGLGLPDRENLFSRWRDRLEGGEILHGRVHDLPREEREILEAWGVRSFVVVPIFVESVLRGYLSLEEGDAEREWSSTELEALRTTARTFAASIQRSEAERALADSEEKYRDLLENANDLIQSVAPDGRFYYVNRAWEETLGYADDEVADLRVWDVVRAVSEDEGRREDEVVSPAVATILSGGVEGEGRVETIFVTKGGREIPVEGSVNCRYVDGLPVSTRGIFRDITERKIFDRMIQDFISTVSHELRTPLTSIIASLGLLEGGLLEKRPERGRELVSVALRNSNRLLQLINNLLDLQKLSARKMSFRREEVPVVELFEEALEDIRAFAESYSIRLELGSLEEGLLVRGDRDRLLQVLNNLLSNAIKFSPDDEVVTVSAHRHESPHDGRQVVLTVSDRGPGIPEEFRTRLFDRFTQFDSSSTRRSGGSGLGLSIVKGLVEGMSGRIVLDTEVESGTTFHVVLPEADLEESAPSSPR